MTLQEHLKKLGACSEARIWAEGKTASEAWEACERPNWLLWWAASTDKNSHKEIALAACACARSVLHLVPAGELRPLRAIEAAETRANKPTSENKLAAIAAAYAAVDAAVDAAADAAAAAAAAADAAAAAAYAAYAAYAYAADAAYAAYAAVARSKKKKEICTLLRQYLTQPWKES